MLKGSDINDINKHSFYTSLISEIRRSKRRPDFKGG
jgi:hypothetical protein